MKGQEPSDHAALQQSLKEASDYKIALEESCIVAITDRNGIITYVNDNFCRASKYGREELTGRELRMIYSGVHSEAFINEVWATIANGKIWRGELQNKAKDGSFYWVHTTLVPFFDDEKKPCRFIAIDTDITERKKAEEDAIYAYKEKETVLNRINDSVVSVDNEWRYTFLNDAALATHPADRKDVLGKSIWEVHPEMKGTVFWDKYHEAMETKKVIAIESYYQPMKIWFSVKIYPSSDGLTIFYTDVTARNEAEEKIRTSETRLLKAQEIGKLGYWQQDLNSNKIWASKEAKHIYGFAAVEGELAREEIVDCIVDADQVNQATINLITYNKEFNIEFRIHPADGSPMKYIAALAEVEKNKDGTPVRLLGTLLDITERKKAEHEIVLEKNFSASIINSLPGIFYLYDQSGKFIKWNKNFETVSGYATEEIARMHPLDFFDTNEKELLQHQIDLVFEKGIADVEAHFYTKAKEKIPYYFNGHIANLDGTDYLMGVGIDITERKKTEIALKESEEKYRYLFNNNPALIIIWDVENFRILEANDVAYAQYGYTPEEFINMTVLDYRPEEDRQQVKDFARALSTGQESKVKKIWRHLRKNGEMMYMDILSHRIVYNGHKAIISLAKNITEQIIAENQLKETYDDIRRLNAHLQTVREEERTSIAREIHDELGQQLTALKMDASWLTKKVAAEEKAQHEKLAGMIGLIDDTVKSVRRISSDLRPGILDDLGLVAALEWQSSEFEKRTGIQCTFLSPLSEVHLDKNLATGIFRIYQETLTNVMRHAKATSVASAMTQTDELVLSIRDNGEGFDTMEVKIKKTLGLTGMRERAMMFGGQLTIESKKGQGTTVILKIPLTSSDHNDLI